jgi:hypothetical protein
LVTFFAQAKKVTRPPLRGTKLAKSQHQTRGKPTASNSLDSRLRGNDEVCGEIAKIDTILTPTLSLKEREKCGAARRA